MTEFDHNRILAAVARSELRPLGLRQKGRSRFWFDDRGWWLVIVEFQASQWSKGSYLNVAPMWLWRPTVSASLNLDFSGRIGGFLKATDEEQFTDAATTLALTAAHEVKRWRALINDDTGRAADAIESAPADVLASYPDFNGGVACGLTKHWSDAERLLTMYCERVEEHDTMRHHAQDLLARSGTPAFVERVDGWIANQRRALRLGEAPAPHT